jgi:integrase
MVNLAEHLDEYLRLRRALGHQLADAARLLPHFVSYLEEIGASHITVDNALAWVTQPEGSLSSSIWMHRMIAVRGFARHMSGIDPAHQVPPLGLVSFRRHWRQPYIYSDAEVVALMAAVPSIIPTPLRAATQATMIGLLATTGMRVGEAIALGRADLDWGEEVITVRNTKFDKSREVPIEPSTTEALRAYAELRDWVVPQPMVRNFFTSAKGTPIFSSDFGTKFRELIRITGVGADSPRPPRVHDLRHSFALKTLVRWYRDGEDVGRLLPRLSTYLGHLTPGYTYWYLSAAPELLELAAARLEKRSHL